MKSSITRGALLLAIILVLAALNGCANPLVTAGDLVSGIKDIVREGAECRNETMVNEMNEALSAVENTVPADQKNIEPAAVGAQPVPQPTTEPTDSREDTARK